jgi:hypothetical protein
MSDEMNKIGMSDWEDPLNLEGLLWEEERMIRLDRKQFDRLLDGAIYRRRRFRSSNATRAARRSISPARHASCTVAMASQTSTMSSAN